MFIFESVFIEMFLKEWPSPPKHGPRVELHLIACWPSFEHSILNGFFSLLTKLNIKALGSVSPPPLECHFCSVKPPKIFPLFAFITVNVLGIPSQWEWKSVDLKPSLDARYFKPHFWSLENSHNFNNWFWRHGPSIFDSNDF